MQITFIMTIINLIILIAFISAVVYLFMLIIRALKKYINSQDVRKEKSETRKSLGEVLKKYRTDNKMTQEFVAESLGVSRQAVSKWEQGTSEPSTSNMIALAKLYGVTPEELLKGVRNA
ncbi:MAG TPA: helix-turn-helix domain-containing protein [Candidatus Mediterraneibacter surreyensis]|nr:helix-turn-helix domain-containing protein [Candidatus Mediterraneibacter surreyensis]